MPSNPDFKTTRLWRQAFANPQTEISTEEQEFFRDHYLAMRDKVGTLVSRIAVDMPTLTVHDLTHLDALWETASLVSEGEVLVSPAEAFVFGASVLLHDAAMSLAAFPNGVDDLKKSIVWKDVVANLIQDRADEHISPDNPPSDILQRAIPQTLRRLHAEKAAVLAEQGWTAANGDVVHLIDNEELRFFYGSTIGQIANSHWWPVSRVEQEFQEDLGPFSQKTKSKIDKMKLACLLRVSDALHLDQRRAPRFLRALVRPEGISGLHWDFQERLSAPYLDGESIVFTTGTPFSLAEADAWWLAYDTMSAVDQELRDVFLLMQGRGRGAIRARGVKGAGKPESLARTIQTRGWRPVDTQLRVSDIPRIVETLGGAKLYGDDPTVALRELIQNGADAVQARRKCQSRPETWGQIKVSLSKRGTDYYLAVEDSGVGMSEQVMTGPLIDFGSSFWRSPLANEEFPGLASAGMNAIGRYGIGFFSVFMLGSEVRVSSRRFDRGEASARVLEFRDGTASRPILRPAAAGEAPLDGGTRVEVKLKQDPRGPNGLLSVSEYSKEIFALQHLVAAMAPNLDVTIESDEDGNSSTAVNPSDWLALDDQLLLRRLSPSSKSSPTDSDRTITKSSMRPVRRNSGAIFGRAFIKPRAYSFSADGGWVTVGGLRTARLANIEGVLLGEILTAARNSARPTVPKDILSDWATEQARIISSSSMDDEQKSRCAEVILECGGQALDLPIASWGGEWLGEQAFRTRLSNIQELIVSFKGEFDYDEDADDVHPRDFKNQFQIYSNVLIVVKHDGSILKVGRQSWPRSITGMERIGESNLAVAVRRILGECWVEVNEDQHEDREIGSVGSSTITRSVTVFTRGNSQDATATTPGGEVPF